MQDHDKLIISCENILQCFMPLFNPVATHNNIVYNELIFVECVRCKCVTKNLCFTK